MSDLVGNPEGRFSHNAAQMSFTGKKINRVACGSAHSLAWSTNKPVSAGKLPTAIPMEYNHLQVLPITTLRNRIVLLHHFSDLFCPSICMFDLQDHSGEKAEAATGLDRLRGVIVSSAKVLLTILMIFWLSHS